MPRSEPAPEPEPEPRLRADAARNRQVILAAARELYGDRGLDAAFDDIARAAGVGNATVYRHFPSRCVLITAVFGDTLRRVIEAADTALEESDPWTGFARHVRFLCQMQAEDRALADLLTTQLEDSPAPEELAAQAYARFVRLAEGARADGSLRSDFAPQDLVVLLMANAGSCIAPPTALRTPGVASST